MIPTIKEKIKQNILDTDLKSKKDEEKVKEVFSTSTSKNIKNDTLLSGTRISNSTTRNHEYLEQSTQEMDFQEEFDTNLKNTFQQFIERIVNAIIEFLTKLNPFLRNKSSQKIKKKKELKDLSKKLSKK